MRRTVVSQETFGIPVPGRGKVSVFLEIFDNGDYRIWGNNIDEESVGEKVTAQLHEWIRNLKESIETSKATIDKYKLLLKAIEV